MHEYDTAFKVLPGQVDLAMREIAGTTIERWLNVELPAVQNTRVDLLGETPDNALVHIELQSTNDPAMQVRMIEYGLRVFRLFRRFPEQILLYVGDAPMSMERQLSFPTLSYTYQLVDIRDLGGERLLESGKIGDNIISLLTRLPDVTNAARLVLRRIAKLTPEERQTALSCLLILSGLRRGLGEIVEEEAKKMPILNDIREHPILGREYNRGLEEGVVRGVQQGELSVVRRLIAKRFGDLPVWADQRLQQLSVTEIESLAL